MEKSRCMLVQLGKVLLQISQFYWDQFGRRLFKFGPDMQFAWQDWATVSSRHTSEVNMSVHVKSFVHCGSREGPLSGTDPRQSGY